MPRNTDADGGELLTPLAFDPSAEDRSSRGHSPTRQEPSREYFSQSRSDNSSHPISREGQDLQEPSSRASLEGPSPHIAYLEKNWVQNGDGSPDKAPAPTLDSSRYTESRSNRSSFEIPISLGDTSHFSRAASPDSSRPKRTAHDTNRANPLAPVRPSNELHRLHDHGSTDSGRSEPSGMLRHPTRGDSLETQTYHTPKKETGASPTSSEYGDLPILRSDTFKPTQSTPVKTSQSDSTQLDGTGSPSLLRYNTGGDFSMDQDLSRILGGEEPEESANRDADSFLRRVSNSVRHGRSFSEKSLRSKDGKNPRSPGGVSITSTDVGSPVTGSQTEELFWLRNELRKERQRVAELESAARATANVKQVNTELSEKRSTMVVLDAQREIVFRELTVLTDHMEAEKRGGTSGPLDLGRLSNHVLRELAESIQKLKESYAPQIEGLIQQRNDLSEELDSINSKKERSFQEFEQLSLKNAQLAELNNQLVHQVQELYRAKEGQPRPDGLGISHNKAKSAASIEVTRSPHNDFQPSISSAHMHEDSEPATATVVPGPQVVNIRKGKFNWKKGGQNVAKGVKGLKGAFLGSEGQDVTSGLPRSQTQDPSRQGFGFFGNQRHKQGGKMPHADSVPVLADLASDAGQGRM